MALRLFDIPSKLARKAWSPNVWKVRYALNYKNLPYETTWVEFPDIASTCMKIGVRPKKKGRYTLPVIEDTQTGGVVSDSLDIVEYLESMYPPSDPDQMLIQPGMRGIHEEFSKAFSKRLSSLWPIAIPRELKILNLRSEEYIRRTRERWLVPENSEEEKVEKYWKGLEKDFGVVDSWIGEKEEFFMGGRRPTFSDFEVAALMMFCRTIWGAESEEWGGRIAKWHGGRWGWLMKRFEKFEKIV